MLLKFKNSIVLRGKRTARKLAWSETRHRWEGVRNIYPLSLTTLCYEETRTETLW